MTDDMEYLSEALADRYTIERELGAGGMATVYLAEDVKHHRKVAVKVLRTDLAAALGSERFLREIKITAQLNHPHIVPLLDSGIVGDRFYYVMPFMRGATLRDRIVNGKGLGIEEAIGVACQICQALSYAHDMGVVHRDVKPENIIVSDGHAMLLDFGISRAMATASGHSLTASGVVVGTPAYMSPEQASGEELDGRSDIYSLACVLFEAIAGEEAFGGPNAAAVLTKLLTNSRPELRAKVPRVPRYVSAAVKKAMAKTPDERFSSATDFAESLAGVALPRTRDIPRRSRLRLRLTIGAFCAVLMGGGALVGQRWFVNQQESETLRVVVAPLIDGQRIGFIDPGGAWGFAEELRAMFLSDTTSTIVDKTMVTDAVSRAYDVSIDSTTLSLDQWFDVSAHVNASRLVLLDLYDGSAQGVPTVGFRVYDVRRQQVVSTGTVGLGGRSGSEIRAKIARMVASTIRNEGIFPNWRWLRPDDPHRWMTLREAIDVFEAGFYSEATTGFQQMLNLQPDNTAAALGLIQAATLRGGQHNQEAAEATRRAWELRSQLTPEDRNFLVAYIGLSQADSSTNAARAELITQLSLDSANLAESTGDLRGAVFWIHRYLTLLIRRNPADSTNILVAKARTDSLTLAVRVQSQLRTP